MRPQAQARRPAAAGARAGQRHRVPDRAERARNGQGGAALRGQGVLLQDGKGKAKALAGVKVTDGVNTTDKSGATTVTASKPGKLTLVATQKGYIRAEATVDGQ